MADAVLALLDDDDARAQLHHCARGAHEVRLVRELLDLAVVDDQAVDAWIVLTSDSRAMSIQRFIVSSATKRAPGHCSRTARCRSGWMLARNRTSASREASRELRLEVLEDVEVGLQRVADVDVALVAAGPEERLAARDVLDVVGDHAAVVQDGVLGLAEVVAHGPDDAGLGEERGGEREVHGGAAQQAVALAGLGLDGVKGDGSDHGERHKAQEQLAGAAGCSASASGR